MSSGKRPGGLTALAVINFVIGFLSIFGVITMVVMMKAGPSTNEAQQEQIDALQNMDSGLFMGFMILNVVTGLLMVASGVGYLKLSRFWGFKIGNAYAILSILSGIVSIAVVSDEATGGFSILSIFGFIYPVLTLILLNTTFKEDFHPVEEDSWGEDSE